METNIAAEKDDLATAKRDLLLRFINDQEKLQTSEIGQKLSNNDETFDILDAVSKDSSNNIPDDINNITPTQNKNSNADLHKRQRVPRAQTCIPHFRNERSRVGLNEKKLQCRIGDDKMSSVPRPATEGSLRRLRSAPRFSGRQSRNILCSGDIDVKTRKLSSLSIVVPKEEDIDKLTRRRSSFTCSQVKSPRTNVSISTVDVELFNKHTTPSIAGPYTLYHLPPIASSETAPKPPST